MYIAATLLIVQRFSDVLKIIHDILQDAMREVADKLLQLLKEKVRRSMASKDDLTDTPQVVYIRKIVSQTLQKLDTSLKAAEQAPFSPKNFSVDEHSDESSDSDGSSDSEDSEDSDDSDDTGTKSNVIETEIKSEPVS